MEGDGDTSLHKLFYDNQTSFLGEKLSSSWGDYPYGALSYAPYRERELYYDCELSSDGEVIPPPLDELLRELVKLEQVVQGNIALSRALPEKETVNLTVTDGKVDTTPLFSRNR
jgi:hypothetical protein